MAIYELRETVLRAVPETTFSEQGVYERRDIQRVLRENIKVLGESLLVIAEEFGEWIDSNRRIDLLCLDTDANLVVVELKRTDDGGHMELQAIRYAAMVSKMTFDQLLDTHARFLNRTEPDIDAAKSAILEFLSWDSIDEDRFGTETRIVLASADFSKELTTAVMWLNDHDVDIKCVRLKPYRLENGPMLLDIQQLVPLPEAESFQTQIGVKRQAERQGRAQRHELRFRFWDQLLVYAKSRTSIHANRRPGNDTWISGGIGRTGFALNYVVRQTDAQVELWIDTGQADRNRAAFEALKSQKDEIDLDFGEPLIWQEVQGRSGYRIAFPVSGGYRSPSDQVPGLIEALVDAMIRLDRALRSRVAALR